MMDAFDLRKWNGFKAAGGNLTPPAMVDHIAIDSRRVYTPATLFVALPGSKTDGHRFVEDAANSGAKFAIVRKDYRVANNTKNLTLLKVDDPLQALQEISGAYRNQFDCEVIGITGSYGKTMVKDLLYELLSASNSTMASPESFNSQIGVPLSLLKITKNNRFAFIEAGFSKKGEMEKLRKIISPHHVILTHVGKKHMDGLGSQQTIASEMQSLLFDQTERGWSLVPNHNFGDLNKVSKAKSYCWDKPSKDLPQAKSIQTDYKHLHSYQVSFPDGNTFEGIITTGHYYFLDLINICTKAAWLLGVTSDAIRKVLRDYIPVPMRTEMWQNPMGGTIINEPYCSDPQSVDLALNHFTQAHPGGKKVLLFGGIRGFESFREKDFERIGGAIAAAKVDTIHLVGKYPYSPLIETMQKKGLKPKIIQQENYEEAFRSINDQIKPNDTVIIKGDRKNPLESITKVLQGSISTNQCFINLAAVSTNLKILRKKLGNNTRLMPIIKASAYGTDNAMMAKFLAGQGIDIFGVSYVDEGVALRTSGIKQEIFTINAAIYEVTKAVDHNLQIGVSDMAMVKALAEEGKKQHKLVKVHLHVDTGMSRLGCRKEEALALAKEIVKYPSLKLEGIMTHFAAADSLEEDRFTRMQVDDFDRIITQLELEGISIPWKHAANSSGAIRFNLPQYNMARIGLALYGIYSSPKLDEQWELKLALSLQSRIVGINLCKKGETVSYGRNYTIEKDNQRIAVVPIGYFDGLHRHYSGKGSVIIHGQKAPMIGNICMDYLMVDISHIPHASIGDQVLIFGEDEQGNYLSPETLASQGNSIAHELITCLGPRIQRVFIYEETPQSC